MITGQLVRLVKLPAHPEHNAEVGDILRVRELLTQEYSELTVPLAYVTSAGGVGFWCLQERLTELT